MNIRNYLSRIVDWCPMTPGEEIPQRRIFSVNDLKKRAKLSKEQRLMVNVVVFILICGTLVGWRVRRGPEWKIQATLSEMNIQSGDIVTLTVENKGARAVKINNEYTLWLENPDRTTDPIELELDKNSELVVLKKGETWSQEIFTDLESGKYNIIKKIEYDRQGPSLKTFDLIISEPM